MINSHCEYYKKTRTGKHIFAITSPWHRYVAVREVNVHSGDRLLRKKIPFDYKVSWRDFMSLIRYLKRMKGNK